MNSMTSEDLRAGVDPGTRGNSAKRDTKRSRKVLGRGKEGGCVKGGRALLDGDIRTADAVVQTGEEWSAQTGGRVGIEGRKTTKTTPWKQGT